MNSRWQHFLTDRGAEVDEQDEVRFAQESPAVENGLYALTDHGILAVTGPDAETFLQGQATCDFRSVSNDRSSLGAFCNPKGRVITTFRAVRTDPGFALIMPARLLPALQKRLQMYVLRSRVQLTDVSDGHCLLGLCTTAEKDGVPVENDAAAEIDGATMIRLRSAGCRFLILAGVDVAMQLWRRWSEQENFAECGSPSWRRLEIRDGHPAIVPETSEEFVPQMLNLDLLGGISFKKGCYTGQEIVARMHYLGKLKRRMYLGRCRSSPAPGTPIFSAKGDTEQSVGSVILASTDGEQSLALAVLQISHAADDELRLVSAEGEPIEITPFAYFSAESVDKEP